MPRQAFDILDFQPKPITRFATAMQRFWHSPRFSGWENIDPKTPSLFVGNHTIFGMMDAPVIVDEVYLETGVYLRALADRLHFALPYGKYLLHQGAVEGSRENCDRLMEAGQSIIVFPGGGREVCKRKGEAYQLIWKQRTGFARMAIQHGYPIIPVASVGPEECYTIHIDANDIINSPIGTLMKKTGILKALRNGEAILPFATGIGPTMIPRSERFYINFGPAIPTSEYDGRFEDKDALWDLRKKVENAIYSQIADLKKIQQNDPNRRLIPRF